MRLPVVNLRLVAASLGVVFVVLLAGGGWLWWKGRPDSLYQSAEEYYRQGERLRGGDDLHKKSDQDLEKCRSAYERVFLNLVSGRRLVEGGKSYTPTGMRGWYQAVFRRDSDGRERVFSIDELVGRKRDWRSP